MLIKSVELISIWRDIYPVMQNIYFDVGVQF